MTDPTRLQTAGDPITAAVNAAAFSTAGEPAVSAPPAPPPAVPGYDLGEEIGRGGMGVVFRGRDRGIGRDVAVKVLQERFAPDSGTAARFVDEARITGQLQHPGIPAVYQVGTLPDGRPFLAMKLIKGNTLDDLLKAGGVSTLAVFEAICQAVGYAHAHGVLHRDLKPANVMVGSFGEVQVMDWGLAKLLAGGGRQPPGGAGANPDATAPSTEIRSARAADTPFTQYGSVMGTPAYMAPEQAAGETDKVDRRADVFGLGAVLCRMLTGCPPFDGATADEVRLNAVRGNTAAALARLDGCGAEPGLVALCKGCLSFDPAGRPADGNAVAATVAGLRTAAEERAKQAELDKARAEVAAAEQTKRRRVIVWAGGIALGLLLAGIAGTTTGLVLAEIRRGEADHARGKEKDRADSEEKAKVKAKIAFDVLDAMTSAISGEAFSADWEINPEQKKFLSDTLTHYREIISEEAIDEKSRVRKARAAGRIGLIESRLGHRDESVAAFRMACDEYAALAAAFPNTPTHRQAAAGSHHNLGMVLADRGERMEAAEQYRTALAIREQLVADFPAEPEYRAEVADSHGSLGLLFAKTDELTEAERHLGKAMAILEKVAAEAPTDPTYRGGLANSYNILAALLKDPGRQAKVEELHWKALDIQEKLIADFPAIPAYRQRLAITCNNLGQMLKVLRPVEAESWYRKALDLRDKLAIEFPAVPEYRHDLARTHSHLGALLPAGRVVAEKHLRKAISLLENLSADSPAVLEYRNDLVGAYCNFANWLNSNKRQADSLEWYTKAIDTIRPVHEKEPRDVQAKIFLRNCYLNRAIAYDRLRKYDEVVKDRDKGVELSPKSEQPALRVSRASALIRAEMVAEAVAEVVELRKLTGWNAVHWYRFATVYAVASGKVAGKKDEYAVAAVEMLQKAVKVGYKDAAHLKADKDFDPIREREEFKKLVADLEAKFPPKREELPAPRRE